MPSIKKPRRGSLQFWPRKRARRIYPRVGKWPASKEARPLGFAGWKAGMTHIIYTENNANSPNYGKSVSKPVTVIDAAPLSVIAYKYYNKDKCVGEIWSDKIIRGAEQKIGKGKRVGKKVDVFDDVRLLVATQPDKSGMKKNISEIFELGVGGEAKKKEEYAVSMLGKEIHVEDVFKAGETANVGAVTKGHGFTGPVKRFGIRIQTRKDQQHHRHAGSIGSTVPRKVDWRVPLPGQYGFFSRMEYHKRIVMIEDGKKVTPAGGFVGYGVPKHAVLIEGSVPGHRKRLVKLRKSDKPVIPIEIREISLQSKQGR